MEFIQITDKETGQELTVTRPDPIRFRKYYTFGKYYTITETGKEPIEVSATSIRKVIRTWMKERR